MLFVVALAPLLASCTTLTAGNARYWIALEQADDRITLAAEDNTTIFDIHSPRGIGGATVRWMAGHYPAKILLRFHLQGLEGLRFAYDTTVVELSISSVGDGSVYQSVSPVQPGARATQALTAESRYWMQTALAGRGASAQNPIPLTEGWIEVHVPPDFITGRHTGFSIHWVDFYRG